MTVYPLQNSLKKALSAGLLVALVFGSASQARAQTVSLPRLNLDIGQTSISGLSSGGYIAVQFAVAFSAIVKGVGVIAGNALLSDHTIRAPPCHEAARCLVAQHSVVARQGSWRNVSPIAATGQARGRRTYG